MPQLQAVQQTKVAGFVDESPRQKLRRERQAREEAELEALIAKELGTEDAEEEDAGEEEPDSKAPAVPEVQTEEDTKQEGSDAEDEAQEESGDELDPEEKSFKKRYGDLRRFMSDKEKAWKDEKAALEARLSNQPANIRPPKSDEDIAAWAKKYPDVASIVETIAAKKAEALFSKAEGAIKSFEDAQYEATRMKVETDIRKAHPDFDDLAKSEAFHKWAEEQPKWVQDAVYENSDDAKSAIRVFDLYKVDNNMTPSAKRKEAKDAAASVSTKTKTALDATGREGVYKESQIMKMSDKQYEEHSDRIEEAMRTGKFVYDVTKK